MPQMLSSSVFIRGLRVHARHGVMPQERTVGADFTVDVSLDTDITQAALTDDLAATISYADVAAIVQREMQTASDLLEHAAYRIATALLDAFPQATAVELELTKHCPPMKAECAGAGVRLRLNR